MSFPDPSQPPNPFISPPYSGGDAAAYWPSFWVGAEQQQQQQPDLMPQQFDRHPQSKKPRISEKPPTFTPFQAMNPRINQTNVPSNKGTSNIFYKTRICAKFMEGTCRNGDQCTFAHGVEDLREPPPNWQDLIREKERSNGGGNWGDDQRMLHKMKICKKYYNGEECPYGDKCNFLHQRPSPPMKKLKVEMPGQRESSAISIGVTGDGRGNAGELDPMAGWKMRLCSRWEMGQCNYGERCHFAHGQSDLRFPGSGDEGEPAIATNGVRKVPSVSALPTPSAAAAAPANGDGEEKRISKWKLTKKINRIYADWLDDLTPPHGSPSKEYEL